MTGKIVSICISKGVGSAKHQVETAELRAGYGIVGDGHAETVRPVSIAMAETAAAFAKEHGLEANPGDFAENILVGGIDLKILKPGDRIFLGPAVLELVQIGKETRPDHYSFHGYRLLPAHGYFCKVLEGGTIKPGDVCRFDKD
ncbi:MAG: MOSC domain-containing protein [Erysipelotrichia bacterium]|nr:MOSC domain-containing protein [Erysipelotrichia bacterium]